MYPVWHPELVLGRVPPGSVEHEQDALPLARSHFPGEVLQGHREHLGVDGGEDQPVDLPRVGAREGVEVGPLVAPVDLRQRPLTDGAPCPAQDRLEAQAVLVLAPQSWTFAVGWASFSLATLIGSLF